MSDKKYKIIYIEDDLVDQMIFVRYAKTDDFPYHYLVAGSVKTARQLLQTEQVDAAVIDYFLGDGIALDLFADLANTPIIVVTGIGDEGIAVSAMKSGAYDYLVKDVEGNYLKTLPLIIEKAMQHKSAERELKKYRERLEELVQIRTIELKQEVNERRRIEQKFRSVVEQSGDGIILSNDHGDIFEWNQSAERITGLKRSEVLGQKMWDMQFQLVLPERQTPEIYQEIKVVHLEALASHQLPRAYQLNEVTIQRHDGTRRIIQEVAFPIETDQGFMVGSIIRDITEHKQTEQTLWYAARCDSLTGLPNRLMFTESLVQAIQRTHQEKSYRFALLFINLNRFNLVNDSLGYLVGDKMLMVVANRLQQYIQLHDVLARLASDEFAILMHLDPNFEPLDEIKKIVERIKTELMQPIQLTEQHQVFTTANIGIALSRGQYQRPEEILRDANIAMYQAKARGRGEYKVFEGNFQPAATDHLRLESELWLAILRHEFELYYQPVVGFNSDGACQLVSLEALVRWQHPEKGLLSPGKFVLAAEEADLIAFIDKWVLQTACAQVKHWRSRRHRIGIGVNMSVSMLRQPDILELIAEVLKNTGLPAEALYVEITENAALKDLDLSIAAFKKLNDMGIKITLDDFGIGHTSLDHLKNLPLRTLKIDKSFVANIGHEAKNEAIIAAIIDLAHRLDLTVIAEGVETEEQLLFLYVHHCDGFQGYLFSKPLPAAEVPEFLEHVSKIKFFYK